MYRYLFLPIAAALCGLQSAAAQVEITTDFPGGNVTVLNNEAGAIRLKPDLRGGRDWFYWHFEATPKQAGEVEFVFEGKLRIGVRGPAVSTDGGINWDWLGTDTVRYSQKGAGGDAESTEAFRYRFTAPDQAVRFAVAIPYRQRELDEFFARIDGNPHLTLSELTRTRGGKAVELLRIGEPAPDREAIIVSARHHACESMASYVLEGFLERAMSDTPAGRGFRERYVVYAVPMMDKDGVQAGDQGKWRFPHDHNRDYGEASIYPEVIALQKLAREVDVRLALDFHCPSLRGETHEVFYFIGVGLPHIRANTDELRGWIGEERPQTVRTAPFNFLRDPPDEAPAILKDTKFSVWFTYLPGVRFAATFEIPYSQAAFSFDAAMARDYGIAVLRAWQRTEFVADPETRSPTGYAGLMDFRKKFSTTYKARPDEAEQMAYEVLASPDSSPAFKAEARNSSGLLRLRQKRFAEALDQFTQVADDATQATTGQRLTAATKRVVCICQDPQSQVQKVEAAIARFDAFSHPSQPARFEAYGAVTAFFDKASDPDNAIEFARLQLTAASKIQRGETLNRIAGFHDQLNHPDQAVAARREAVAHLREQLDPVPVGIFGVLMARDLFEALLEIPDATLEEKRQAAQLVFDHPIASSKIKEEIRATLATLESVDQ